MISTNNIEIVSIMRLIRTRNIFIEDVDYRNESIYKKCDRKKLADIMSANYFLFFYL